MTVLLKTIDQIPGRGTFDGPSLNLDLGQVTARAIIRARVIEEVEHYNRDGAIPAHAGLITPAPQEEVLNRPRHQRRQLLDPERQVDVALAAVRAGRVIILFNGEQVSDLDAPLPVTPVSEARFLRLLPLAGG